MRKKPEPPALTGFESPEETAPIESSGPQKSELEMMIAEIHTQKKTSTLLVPGNLVPAFNHISCGPFLLDFALQGGIPEGLAVELYGMESSGKSTLSARVAASIQSKHPEKSVLWIDAESTYDPEWVVKHGVDPARIIVVRPSSGEEAIDVIAAMMDVWEIAGVVVDSVPSLIPMIILENAAGDDTMAALPRLMAKLCAKILMSWNKERDRGHFVTVVFINQWRSKVGFVMGDPRTLPGGKQLQYLVTTKVELKNNVVMGKDVYGNEIAEHNEHTFGLIKSKIGNTIRNGKFNMIVNPDNPYGVGTFDDFATVATYAKKFGYITGGGAAWRIRHVDKKFRNLAEICSFLFAEPDWFLQLKQQLIAQNRYDKGLKPLPPDGFLLDWNAKDNVDVDAIVKQQVVKEEPIPQEPEVTGPPNPLALAARAAAATTDA